MICKVKVHRWYKGGNRNKYQTLFLLVEAESHDDAMEKAKSASDKWSDVSRLCVGVEALECSTVKFPVRVPGGRL